MTTEDNVSILAETIADDVKSLRLQSRVVLFAKMSAVSSAIANTETSVLSMSLPANTLVVGNIFRFSFMALHTNNASASTSITRVRIGTTALLGAVAAQNSFVNGTTARTNAITHIEGTILITAIGAAGSAIGQLHVYKGYVSATTPAGTTVPAVVVTTIDNVIALTFISGGGSASETFYAGTIELLR